MCCKFTYTTQRICRGVWCHMENEWVVGGGMLLGIFNEAQPNRGFWCFVYGNSTERGREERKKIQNVLHLFNVPQLYAIQYINLYGEGSNANGIWITHIIFLYSPCKESVLFPHHLLVIYKHAVYIFSLFFFTCLFVCSENGNRCFLFHIFIPFQVKNYKTYTVRLTGWEMGQI